MPVEAKLGALLLAIIDRNPDALAISLCMLNVTTMLSKGLSTESRVGVAEAMRDHPELERRQVVPIDMA